jgi:iron-sulfur cluster repair protein YtfE (RIC family)
VWSFAFKAEPEGTTVTASLETGAEPSDASTALDRIVATAEGRRTIPQARLGQAHTAEGPLDLSAMFVMHHGFRRDLRDLVRAVPATPVTDATAWVALERRWLGMATALHHHHRVEDEALWPMLRERVVALGDEQAEVALKDMESEHGELDSAIGACAAGFRAMVLAPGPGTRTRLSADLVVMQSLLVDHLEHEETSALPLAQRHLSLASWADFENAARKEYGLKDIGFAVPWSTLEIPEDQFAIAYAHGGTLVRAVLAVTQRRFEREHQVAFRHLPVR